MPDWLRMGLWVLANLVLVGGGAVFFVRVRRHVATVAARKDYARKLREDMAAARGRRK